MLLFLPHCRQERRAPPFAGTHLSQDFLGSNPDTQLFGPKLCLLLTGSWPAPPSSSSRSLAPLLPPVRRPLKSDRPVFKSPFFSLLVCGLGQAAWLSAPPQPQEVVGLNRRRWIRVPSRVPRKSRCLMISVTSRCAAMWKFSHRPSLVLHKQDHIISHMLS